MQVSGPVQGASTIPRRRRLNALLAIVAIVLIAVMVALLVWAGAFARSEVGTEDANPNAAGAGSVVIHDDSWNLPHKAGSAVSHDGVEVRKKLPDMTSQAAMATTRDEQAKRNLEKTGQATAETVTGSYRPVAQKRFYDHTAAVIHDDPWNLHPK